MDWNVKTETISYMPSFAGILTYIWGFDQRS